MPTEALIEKFRDLRTALGEVLIERETEISTATLAILARTHHLQLGDPGVAKSMLPDQIALRIEGAKYFSTLLQKQSVVEQLYGPLDLQALHDGHYRRITTGYLPEAHFSFTDEIYKGSVAILNANLWALNERKFQNDGEIVRIPLITNFAASNEGPESSDLAALDDRLDFRIVTKSISNRDSFMEMLALPAPDENPPPVLHISEVEQAIAEVTQVNIPKTVLEALADLRSGLLQAGVKPSDRKFKRSMPIVRAHAYMRGAEEANISDIMPLMHVLWRVPDEFPTVEEIIIDISSPLDKHAKKILTDLAGVVSDVEEILNEENYSVRTRRCVQEQDKMERAAGEIEKLKEQAVRLGVESPYLEEARTLIKTTAKRILAIMRANQAEGKVTPEEVNRIIEGMKNE